MNLKYNHIISRWFLSWLSVITKCVVQVCCARSICASCRCRTSTTAQGRARAQGGALGWGWGRARRGWWPCRALTPRCWHPRLLRYCLPPLRPPPRQPRCSPGNFSHHPRLLWKWDDRWRYEMMILCSAELLKGCQMDEQYKPTWHYHSTKFSF